MWREGGTGPGGARRTGRAFGAPGLPEDRPQAHPPLVPQREKIFRTLTVEENFRMVPMRRPRERADLMAFMVARGGVIAQHLARTARLRILDLQAGHHASV